MIPMTELEGFQGLKTACLREPFLDVLVRVLSRSTTWTVSNFRCSQSANFSYLTNSSGQPKTPASWSIASAMDSCNRAHICVCNSLSYHFDSPDFKL